MTGEVTIINTGSNLGDAVRVHVSDNKVAVLQRGEHCAAAANGELDLKIFFHPGGDPAGKPVVTVDLDPVGKK